MIGVIYIDPKSILDVAVGFGRWGILCREFLRVWEGRNNSKDWFYEFYGVEIFPEAIEILRASFITIFMLLMQQNL
ncbi:MAG: hypothetical protein U5K00_13465 [Melioribacteraceae bacterium]|nr:hypothetical protein [Melioribacteraceae bacterium]